MSWARHAWSSHTNPGAQSAWLMHSVDGVSAPQAAATKRRPTCTGARQGAPRRVATPLGRSKRAWVGWGIGAVLLSSPRCPFPSSIQCVHSKCYAGDSPRALGARACRMGTALAPRRRRRAPYGNSCTRGAASPCRWPSPTDRSGHGSKPKKAKKTSAGIALDRTRREGRVPPSNAAGWSSLVARRAHNPKVVGSNPAPATKAERQR